MVLCWSGKYLCDLNAEGGMKGTRYIIFASFTISSWVSCALSSAAQPPNVPHKMNFAGISLTIHDDARREIQKDVDALTQSPKYFMIKVERARTYFPIVEKIFKEENLPDDFKYLCLQESSLIPDAVSVSKAVGFWQFKDFTALEMGLRVDREIDERMNIVSSTRAAARYIKKNNLLFDNWIYALQSYQMGAGGVQQVFKEDLIGAKHMDITSSTYWYVKKFIAHKIAFETVVAAPPQLEVLTYQNTKRKSLQELATEVSVDVEDLKSYNKWLKSGNIPADKPYTVVIPVKGNHASVNIDAIVAANTAAKAETPNVSPKAVPEEVRADERIKINGLIALKARSGERVEDLARRANVALEVFLKSNEITKADPIISGQYYFISKKRARAKEAYHTVVAGENLWTVSQRYGVRKKKLKKYNRMGGNEQLIPGMTLWLSATKPRHYVDPVKEVKVVEIDKQDAFGWEAEPIESVKADSLYSKKSVDSVALMPEPAVITVTPPKSSEDSSQQKPVADSTRQLIVEVVEEKKPEIQPVVLDTATVKIVVSPDTHTVQPKETLYGLAKRYNIEVMDLVRWNNLNVQDGIKTGQILKLKGEAAPEEQEELPAAVKEGEIIHVVQSTETLYSVARKYGVTIKELMDWNAKSDFNVSVGERLRIVRSK